MFKQYLTVKNGGVYSSVQIPANVPIIELGGDVKSIGGPNDLQIGTSLFLGPSGGVDDYLAHSCDPNCSMHVLGKRAILYSLYVIQVGSELTFDYSTTSTDTAATWSMICKCGSIKCRKVITGISSLSDTQIADYKSKGMIPLFLTNPSFK